MTIEVYSDGACEPNPGPGGWAFVVYENGKELHHAYGHESATTNNRMEMIGALRGLEWIAQHAAGSPVSIFSDSRYTVDGCNAWRLSWKSKGWKRGLKPIANLDLWQAIDAALTKHPIQLTWVKGHAGVEGNERADTLSYMALNDCRNASNVARNVRSPDVGTKQGWDYLTEEFRRVMAEQFLPGSEDVKGASSN